MTFTFEEGGTILVIPPGERAQRVPWKWTPMDSRQGTQEPLIPTDLIQLVIQEQLTLGGDDATNNGSILGFERYLDRLRSQGANFQEVMAEIDGVFDEIPSESNTLGSRRRALRGIRNKLMVIAEETWTRPKSAA